MSIELNAQNGKDVVKEYMKANGMRVRRKFSSVNSAHLVEGDNVRFSVNLSSENLKVVKETKVANSWKLTSQRIFSGSAQKLENKFFKVIQTITQNLKK